MQKDIQNEFQYDNYIDLKELISVLWSGRKKILVVTFLFGLVSVIYALSIPNQYKATVLLAPAQSSSGGLSGALSDLGGLASLAGINVDSGESDESLIAQEIMKSWSFMEEFILENDLMVKVFAAEGWSKNSNRLLIDSDLYDEENNQWLIESEDSNKFRSPSSWELYESFSERLAISEDKKSGLVSISFEYYSPLIAKELLDMYVAAINEHMQKRKIDKVNNNILYLEEQIKNTSLAEMRDVFYNLIGEQTKNKMLAAASPEYALVVVGPSMVPELKSKPERALICIFGSLLGAVLSVLLVFSLHYLKKEYKS